MRENPFKLLEPYGPEEKDEFFGRDAEIVAIYHLLKQSQLVLIYGGSGTGKTSLIRAGLPKVFKTTDWFRVPVRRKDNINDSFQKELKRLLNDKFSGVLTKDIENLYGERWMPIYLVFDQFEEIFTLGGEKERKDFFESIKEILKRNLPCKIILSMREEYIGHLYDYENIVPTLFDKRFRVEPMKDTTVNGVVEKMCAVNQIELDNEKTVNQILENVKLEKKQAAYLPYLQVYLHYLFGESNKNSERLLFDKNTIDTVGNIEKVLKDFIDNKVVEAQDVLNGFSVAPTFSKELLDKFATGDGTKKAQRIGDLSKMLKVSEQVITKALLFFSDTAKLLRADENDVSRYEPVHDVVAKKIHDLRSAEDKEFQAFFRKLELDFERWESEKDKDKNQRLLSELDLSRVGYFDDRLAKDEKFGKWKVFIEKSERHVKAKKRNKGILNGALIGITVAALIAGGTAYFLKIEADASKEKSELAKIEAICFKEDAEDALEKLEQKEESRQKAETEKVMTQINDLKRRYEGLRLREKAIANSILNDAMTILSDSNYIYNIKLQEEKNNIEKLINQ